ncbi:MAG: bile acid:sodium symporter family protein [Rhizobiaceae bacterium]
MTPLDDVALNFSPGSLLLLNFILGIVMFGVALDLKIEDFQRLLRAPVAFLAGFGSQFIFLPAATFLLVILIQPQASVALGMMMVAACPGGNISNFFTHRAGGTTALSVSLTAVATMSAVIMTPFNLAFWGSFYEPSAALVRETSVSPLQMAFTVAILLVVPLILGMTVNARYTKLAERLRGPMRIISMLIFAAFVIGALAANWQHFLDYVGVVFLLVLVHNAIALSGGYGIAFASGLPERDRRAISIETGIQNSGLGLILIFNFFDGLGGMAIVAAWWGVWHIISGFAVAAFFRSRGIAAVA